MKLLNTAFQKSKKCIKKKTIKNQQYHFRVPLQYNMLNKKIKVLNVSSNRITSYIVIETQHISRIISYHNPLIGL